MILRERTSSVKYSITEHVSQFRGLRDSVRFGSFHSNGRVFDSLKEYRDGFRNVPAALGLVDEFKLECLSRP